MLLFRMVIPRIALPDADVDRTSDTIYVEANNPETALIGGVRWYDTFFNCRDKESEREIIPTMVPPTTVIRGGAKIKRYDVWYKVRHSNIKRVAVFAFGRSTDEAMHYADKYGKFAVSQSKLDGVGSVERAL